MSAPHIDHIGILVEALEPAILAWGRLLPGAPLTKRSLPDVGLEVAEFKAANIVIELLEYAAKESSLAREVMGDVYGINHLSISVPDLAGALAALALDGVAPMTGFPRPGAHGQIAFLGGDSRLGARVELCQPDADPRTEDKHDE